MTNKQDTPQAHIESASEAAEIAKQKAEEAAKVAAAEAKVQAAEKASEESCQEPASKKDASETGQTATSSFKPIKHIQAWLTETFPGNENAVLGGIAGLAIACLFFAIGFSKTLFIVILVLIGVAVGQYADGDPKLARAIQKLIKKN